MRADGFHAPEQDTWPQLVDELVSKHVEPTLIQPTFLLDYPIEISPLAKDQREQVGLVERFELFMGGIELANAFTELNDPDEQRRRFEAQRRLAAAGDVVDDRRDRAVDIGGGLALAGEQSGEGGGEAGIAGRQGDRHRRGR